MRNSKHGLKALLMGIMTVLGAMALAAGAQAQTHTELLAVHNSHNASGGVLNPTPLTDGGAAGKFSLNLGAVSLPVPITAAQIGTGVLLVAGRSIEVRCTTLTLGAGSQINNLTDASGTATFGGCHTYDHKELKLMPQCELKELLTIKASALVLAVLHGGKNFLLFEPQVAGTPFTTISYKPEKGCTLPLNNPVTGNVVAEVEQLEGATLGILFSRGIQLLLGDVLAFGGFPSYITAEGTVSPTGAGHTKIGVH